MKKLFQGNNRIYCLTNIFVCLLCTGYLCTGYCSINSENQQDDNTNINVENDIDPLSKESNIDEIKEVVSQIKKEESKKVVVTNNKTNTSSKKYVKPKYDSVTGSAIVQYAKNYLGLRYVSGGNSLTKGTDCSGFTKLIYKEFGITLSRSVKAQATNGKYVKKSDLQKGDLVFYGNKSSAVSHVAIYIGNGKVIHQSNPKDGVKISSVNMMVYITARRVITKPASTMPNTEDKDSNISNDNLNNDSVDNSNVNNNINSDINSEINQDININNEPDNNTNNNNNAIEDNISSDINQAPTTNIYTNIEYGN